MNESIIYTGKVCPYCYNETEFVDSKVIYGKSYGMIYLCKACDAYVGVHEGTTIALGRLADKKLRYWKKEAHKYFDNLWKRRKGKGSRSKGYEWLSKQLGIEKDLCHIGMFDVEICRRVVEICKPYYREKY